MEAENAPDLADNGRRVAGAGVGEGRCRCREALQATRGAEAETAAHHQRQVEGRGVNQQAFSDLLLPANVDAAQPTAHEQVRERPLQLLPALAQQPLPPLALDAAESQPAGPGKGGGVAGLPGRSLPSPLLGPAGSPGRAPDANRFRRHQDGDCRREEPRRRTRRA